MNIEWEEKYNTGIEKIDYQHKKLVELIKNLHESLQNQNDPSTVAETILDLKMYTIFHFTTEEKLFSKYDYNEGDRELHLKAHQAFIDEIAHYMGADAATQASLGNHLLTYLKEWLFGHILVSDMKFAKFMKQEHFTEISSDDIHFEEN